MNGVALRHDEDAAVSAAWRGPAPFFDIEFTPEPGATLRPHYRVAVADGLRDSPAGAEPARENVFHIDEEEGQP